MALKAGSLGLISAPDFLKKRQKSDFKTQRPGRDCAVARVKCPHGGFHPKCAGESIVDTGLFVGCLASFCSVSSFIPQALKVIKTGDTATISTRMYTLTVLGFALWTAFGFIRDEWPIILTNSLCFVFSGFILFQKIRSRQAPRQPG